MSEFSISDKAQASLRNSAGEIADSLGEICLIYLDAKKAALRQLGARIQVENDPEEIKSILGAVDEQMFSPETGLIPIARLEALMGALGGLVQKTVNVRELHTAGTDAATR